MLFGSFFVVPWLPALRSRTKQEEKRNHADGCHQGSDDLEQRHNSRLNHDPEDSARILNDKRAFRMRLITGRKGHKLTMKLPI